MIDVWPLIWVSMTTYSKLDVYLKWIFLKFKKSLKFAKISHNNICMHINGNYNDKTLLRPAKYFTHRILSHLQHPFYSEKFTLFQITVLLYPYIRESVLAILENIIIKEKKIFSLSMNLFWLSYTVHGHIRLLVFINTSLTLRLYGFLFNKIALYPRVAIKLLGRFDVWITYSLT